MEMPVLGGLEVTQRLQAAKSPVRIMALSAREDRQYILGVLAAGTSGYFIKGDASPETIINAVRGIARGEQDWFSPSVASQMSALSSQSTQTSLTNREKDILRSVVAGKTNQEIGAMLGLSEEMVEKQLGDIFKKLKVVSRVKAAIRAVEEGLV
jgi:DNA-binding NarL/FixJ family response regulator